MIKVFLALFRAHESYLHLASGVVVQYGGEVQQRRGAEGVEH